jgi:hypothetical protein
MLRLLSMAAVVLCVVWILWSVLHLVILALMVIGLVVFLPILLLRWWYSPEWKKSRKEWAQREASRLNPGALGPDWLPPNVPPRDSER